MFTPKRPRERVILRLHNDAISDPLPKLSLRCPELFAVAANDKRRSFFLLIFLRAQD